MASYDPESLPDLLPLYYKRLFPYGPYFKWLSYGGVPKSCFTQREFSFTLRDDVYIRYQSFSDQNELEKEIQKRCPHKIDIGAIFSHRPKDHKTVKAATFQPQEKEVVFDIDMTDYDDVRTCCSGADICRKCWPLMQIAIKVVDRALREDFGFEHLLWVYSGRRGIHCWVCDEAARKLSQNARSAVAEYLHVVKGGDNQTKKVTLNERNVHPSIRRAIRIVRDHFERYAVHSQDFMGTEELWQKVTALIPHETLRNAMNDRFEDLDTSEKRWNSLKKEISSIKPGGDLDKCQTAIEEIMLQYCYPRLDINVSKGLNHLLKSPFCIHPKTGRVCVPIDPKKVDQFDPFKVPTIAQICDELNQIEKSDEDPAKRVKDYKKTSLREPILVFEEFLRKLEQTWKGKQIEQSDLKMEF